MTDVKSRKRILFVLPALTTGGAEKVLITLMNNLDKDLYEPIFLTVSDKGEIGKRIDPEIPQHSLGMKKVSYAIPSLGFKIAKLKPDIVISTMAHINFALLLLKPFFPKTKFVVREAITPSFFLNGRAFKDRLIVFLYKNLYPMADMVLSPTKLVFEEFKTLLNIRNVDGVVLPNPANIQTSGLQQLNFEPNAERLLLVACGRLHKQKGFDRLIDVLAHTDMPFDWMLEILGEGEERATLEALINKYGLEQRVHLKGLVHNVPEYLGAADCFVLPSRFEGLPNVVLESLACGTKVISTAEAGGIQEIEQAASKGDVTVVETMDDFAEALKKLKPQGKAKPHTSILPQKFTNEHVFTKFHEHLAKL